MDGHLRSRLLHKIGVFGLNVTKMEMSNIDYKLSFGILNLLSSNIIFGRLYRKL